MPKGGGVSGHTHTQEQLDHYANQNNPNNQAHQDNLDNHADQFALPHKMFQNRIET